MPLIPLKEPSSQFEKQPSASRWCLLLQEVYNYVGTVVRYLQIRVSIFTGRYRVKWFIYPTVSRAMDCISIKFSHFRRKKVSRDHCFSSPFITIYSWIKHKRQFILKTYVRKLTSGHLSTTQTSWILILHSQWGRKVSADSTQHET